jgi:hypothetical protein
MAAAPRCGCADGNPTGMRALILGAMLMLTAAAQAGPIPPGNRIVFDVLRNGSPIGTHTLAFRRDGEVTQVEIAIDLAVRVLGIAIYRYTHRNTERWQGDHLLSMVSTTDRNGRPYSVRAVRNGAAIEVESSEAGKFSAPADLVTTSYWHPAFIRGRKLDTQGGRMLEVSVADRGEETIRSRGADTIARRWTIAGDLRLDIWYDRAGAWSKLRFAGEDGSTIEYVRRE